MTRPHLILHDELTWHDREKWNEALSLLSDLFNHRNTTFSEMGRLAMALRGHIDAVDHFIQLNTAQVCPDCQKVCCINRHGYYDYQDLIYITALGLTPPSYGEDILDTDPCQFLSQYGCAIERSIRPFRCNWHFCTELIDFMSAGHAKPLREFNLQFKKLQALRQEMIDCFFVILSRDSSNKTERG
jgi:hypothetical protein